MHHKKVPLARPNPTTASTWLNWYVIAKECNVGKYDDRVKNRIIVAYINSLLGVEIIQAQMGMGKTTMCQKFVEHNKEKRKPG